MKVSSSFWSGLAIGALLGLSIWIVVGLWSEGGSAALIYGVTAPLAVILASVYIYGGVVDFGPTYGWTAGICGLALMLFIIDDQVSAEVFKNLGITIAASVAGAGVFAPFVYFLGRIFTEASSRVWNLGIGLLKMIIGLLGMLKPTLISLFWLASLVTGAFVAVGLPTWLLSRFDMELSCSLAVLLWLWILVVFVTGIIINDIRTADSRPKFLEDPECDQRAAELAHRLGWSGLIWELIKILPRLFLRDLKRYIKSWPYV
jgi:hypothetical protein